MSIKIWLGKCSKKKHPKKFEEFADANIDDIARIMKKEVPALIPFNISVDKIHTSFTRKNKCYIVNCKANVAFDLFTYREQGDMYSIIYLWYALYMFYGNDILYSESTRDGETFIWTNSSIMITNYVKNRKILQAQNNILKQLESVSQY